MKPLRYFFTRQPESVSPAIRAAGIALARESEKDRTIRVLSDALVSASQREEIQKRERFERSNEMEEALAMRGGGPWRLPPDPGEREVATREAGGFSGVAQGAYGETELMLQNVEWRRETNLSWLEFSRWGIQQIILIARLRCLKDPMLLRGVNVSAQYVFGRGVEITSPDEDVAEAIREFRDRNKRTLGQIALADQERAKYSDGNLFWVCFTDRTDTGGVDVRTIDALEIMETITDPNDGSVPWYYRREWIERTMQDDGSFAIVNKKALYPAINYEPTDKPSKIGPLDVMWDSPVLHRKCGSPTKWHFALPLVYAALGYAKAVQRFLEDCMTIRNSLAQFSMTLTTKGGQQAMQGAKQQLSTTVGPNASLWDSNPTAVAGSIFTSGPGTDLKAFSSKGAGGDPGEVREYKLQVAMVYGLPESFFSDMNTSNLATATSLDRPTELNFLEKQEVWREDLTTLALYGIRAGATAPNGKLREALAKRKRTDVVIREAARVRDPKGNMVYEAKQKEGEIIVMVNFPTIIEADVPAQVTAVVQAMTLGNSQGEVVGMDEKEGVRQLYQLIGTKDPEDLLESQYPTKGPDKYDPLRKDEPEPAAPGAPAVKESTAEEKNLRAAMARLGKAFRIYEAANGG